MNLHFNSKLGASYKSNSQKVRVMSEAWLVENMYCTHCGGQLIKTGNNTPAADTFCKDCRLEYELKSSSRIFKKINDGAYSALIGKINKGVAPSFFCLNYSIADYRVKDLVVIPKYFLIEDIIEKRPPLGPHARRHDWIGCFINYEKIPASGKITIISDYNITDKRHVIKQFNSFSFIENTDKESKGWLFDIIDIINKINKEIFTLNEVYEFENLLQLKHQENNNIRPKIRQLLQKLRDKKFLAFLGNGVYKLN